jgi:hypothetical protein
MFAKIVDQNVISYPYDTSTDYSHTAFPEGSDYPESNIYWVHQTEPNNPDPINFSAVAGSPVFNTETQRWGLSWNYIQKTEEEKFAARYNPESFLTSLLVDPDYRQWYAGITDVAVREHLAPVAADAKISGVWTIFNALLLEAIAVNPLSEELQGKVTELAIRYGIPISLSPQS